MDVLKFIVVSGRYDVKLENVSASISVVPIDWRSIYFVAMLKVLFWPNDKKLGV